MLDADARLAGKKILIILHGSIGDVVRGVPVANSIRRACPEASITWAVEPAALPVIEHHPAIDEILVFQRHRWWRHLYGFLAEIRGRRFDLVLDLQRHLKSGLISWWSRAPVRVGFHRRNCKEGNWLFNTHAIPAAGEDDPKWRQYLAFVEFLGIDPAPVEWNFRFTEEERGQVGARLRGLGGEYAVFFVGSRWESKQWFPAETAACAARVLEQHGLSIVLLGGAADRPFARAVEAARQCRLANWVGALSLRETMLVLANAKVAVGPDTGPMHLCAALRTPVVSLWGATSPRRTGPFGYDHLVVRGAAECSPCYRRRCPIGRKCMQSITVGDVLAKVKRALEEGRGGREPAL